MKIELGGLDSRILTDLKSVGHKAQQLGFKAYLVGGVVRDLLLGQKSLDWDIVVEGEAIVLAKAFVLGIETRLVAHAQFGTATLNFADGNVMDLVSARSEHYPHPGALPVVKKGILREDLFRRDFTINALAVSLNPDSFGELQDFYGGYDDLKNKKIRVLHEKSFVDDPTRILRALRFASRFDFKLEAKTLQFLKDALAVQAPLTVKAPRYFAEFRKIFSEKCPLVCLKRLAHLGALDFITPGFVADWKLLLRLQKRVRLLEKTDFYFAKDWSGVFLLAFFARASQDQMKHYVKNFHLTKEERLRLFSLDEIPSIVRQLKVSDLAASDIYEILDPLELEIIYFIRMTTSVNMVGLRAQKFLQKWRMVSLEITGEDLKKLGVLPGRQMGALLRRVLLEKIDGKIKNHKDEIIFAKRLMLAP
jgi:tRNA nucleotidyltransferase (CCA-adding enzyme)